MAERSIYVAGGPVQAGGGIYITRPADDELRKHCLAGDFCYVLTARQMGKSSLMVHAAERLAQAGVCTIRIDLQKIGKNVSIDQWYLGIIDIIAEQLRLGMDYAAWWNEYKHLGETQRFGRFLREVVLERVAGLIVIFVDEIDFTLSLGFPTDDFFAAIRAVYNARAEDPAYRRLTFVLLGATHPTNLIKGPDKIDYHVGAITPFNIGVGIDLTDFTLSRAMPLAKGLRVPEAQAEQAMRWILHWTGGHPYLTQRVCQALANRSEVSLSERQVFATVRNLFFGAEIKDHNLRFVRDWLRREPYTVPALSLYYKILSGQPVPDDERSIVNIHLKLSGIVTVKDNHLVARNRVYRRVFDTDWIASMLKAQGASLPASIESAKPPAIAADEYADRSIHDYVPALSAVTTRPSPTAKRVHPLAELYSRLTAAMFGTQDRTATLEEQTELPQPFSKRVLAPLAMALAEYSARMESWLSSVTDTSTLKVILGYLVLIWLSTIGSATLAHLVFRSPTIVAVGSFVGFLTSCLVGIVLARRRLMRSRLIEERLGIAEEAAQLDGGEARKTPMSDALDRALARRGLVASLATLLAQADAQLTVAEFLAATGILAATFAGWAHFLTRNAVITAVACVLGFFFPRLYVEYVRHRRLKAFNDQLGDSINLLVNSLRAGYSVMQAIETIAQEMRSPASTEFGRVVQEVQFGLTLEHALSNMLRRVPGDDVYMMIAGINIQREVGGNLAEVLDSISHTIRERAGLAGEAESLIKLPFTVFFIVATAMVVIQWTVSPVYFSLAWESIPGQIALLIAYGLISIGTLVSTMSAQSLLDISLKTSPYKSVFNKYLALDLLVGGLCLAIAFSLSVPSVAFAWLIVMLMFRATGGSWLMRLVSLILTSGFWLVSLILRLLTRIGLAVLLALILAGLASLLRTVVQVVLSGPVYLVIGLLTLSIACLIVIVVKAVGALRGRHVLTIEDRLAEFGTLEQPPTLEELELSQSFSERVVLPLMRVLEQLAMRFTPRRSTEAMQHQLDLAGNPYTWGPTEFLGVRLLVTLLFGELGFSLLFMASHLPLVQRIAMVGGAVGVGYYLPILWLRSKTSKRQKGILRSLPDALDLLTICVEAGLGFDGAMAKVANKWDSDLSQEFTRAIQGLQLGKLRREVLRDMAYRAEVPDLYTFVAATVQADQLGVSIARVLRIQADQARMQRRLRIRARISSLNLQQSICLNALLGPGVTLWLLAPAIAQVTG